MHSVQFLQDLAVVMILAGLVTIVFHRFKQPVVLGYIMAGVIIGPHTPPFPLIHDQTTVNTLSELGVILLMFSLGLEFSLRKLTQVGIPALIAALLEILVMFWVGYEIGQFFAWRFLDCVFLGAMLSMSSTTVIIKVLSELGKMKERFAQLIFGILIVEDILGIAMIALLSGIAMTGKLSLGDVGVTLGKLGIFLVVTLVAGLIAVPRLIGYVARFKSNEMLIVTLLALCFGVALLAAKLGYSVALGAFVIGAIIAESREIHRIATLLEPVKDMFSAIFFVSIGLLIDPKMLLVHWQAALVLTVAVIIGKVLTCSFGAFIGGNDARTSLRVGMGLSQIGEFSFIIAALGVSLKVTSDFLYPLAVVVSAITTLSTPYLIKSADGAVSWFDRQAPRSLVNTLGLYTDWVGRLGQRDSSMATRFARRWLAQIALNIALVTAVFVGAGYLGQRRPEWLRHLHLPEGAVKPAIWLAAAVLSLPMTIAISRKLQALGILVADAKVNPADAGEPASAIRDLIAQVIPISGTVILGLYILILSSTLLPDLHVMLVLLAVASVIGWLLQRSFIRVYSKAQVALKSTFEQAATPHPQEAHATPIHPLLGEAALDTVTIPENSPAAGKFIYQLELRSRTGANIVGIERKGVNIVSPGADEELLTGDQVLIIGSRSQLDAARRFFKP